MPASATDTNYARFAIRDQQQNTLPAFATLVANGAVRFAAPAARLLFCIAMKDVLIQNWPLILFAGTCVVLVILALISLRDGPLPYERRGVLLSPAEVTFLRSLNLAVREDWLVFSMVRLADIIKVRPKTRKTSFWQGRIQNKHLDFVICDYETLEVKLAIELEDETPSRTERAQRDKFLNTALHAAGLPLMRVKPEAKYETAALRKDIEDALGIQRKKKR
ncbi:DUF2726 domain-containing protein [Anatilimnocola aggregata]|nr:DUF2726 domain-containing protein [Anatilimnocola aggregata]